MKSFIKFSILIVFILNINGAAQVKNQGKLTKKEIEKQIAIAKKEPCSEIENKLYLINDSYIFWARRGRCSDNNYGHYLIGPGLKDICYSVETLAGPKYKTSEGLGDLFEKLMINQNKPNLGLDSTYKVKLLFDGKKTK